MTFSAPNANEIWVNMVPCESTSTPVNLKAFPAGMMTFLLRPSNLVDSDWGCFVILPLLEYSHSSSLRWCLSSTFYGVNVNVFADNQSIYFAVAVRISGSLFLPQREN